MARDRKTAIRAIHELIEKRFITRSHEPGKKATYTMAVPQTAPVPKDTPVPNSIPVVGLDMTGTKRHTAPVPIRTPEHTINRPLTDQWNPKAKFNGHGTQEEYTLAIKDWMNAAPETYLDEIGKLCPSCEPADEWEKAWEWFKPRADQGKRPIKEPNRFFRNWMRNAEKFRGQHAAS
jgi:hypothetical protein